MPNLGAGMGAGSAAEAGSRAGAVKGARWAAMLGVEAFWDQQSNAHAAWPGSRDNSRLSCNNSSNFSTSAGISANSSASSNASSGLQPEGLGCDRVALCQPAAWTVQQMRQVLALARLSTAGGTQGRCGPFQMY